MTDEIRRVRRSDDDEEALTGLLRRITPHLKASASLDPDFDDRLMAQARTEAGILYPRVRGGERTRESIFWAWLAPRTLRISPLGALAFALGFAGLVAVGTLTVASQRAAGRAQVAARQPDAIQVVRFVLVDPAATHVALVGDFNGWDSTAVALATSTEPGAWTVSLPLAPGRHEYAFIVDGKKWVLDPYAPEHTDEFQTSSSVITVGL